MLERCSHLKSYIILSWIFLCSWIFGIYFIIFEQIEFKWRRVAFMKGNKSAILSKENICIFVWHFGNICFDNWCIFTTNEIRTINTVQKVFFCVFFRNKIKWLKYLFNLSKLNGFSFFRNECHFFSLVRCLQAIAKFHSIMHIGNKSMLSVRSIEHASNFDSLLWVFSSQNQITSHDNQEKCFCDTMRGVSCSLEIN